MNLEEQKKLYVDLDDTEYDVLKALRTKHLSTWSSTKIYNGSSASKMDQMEQLDKQLKSLFVYKGPAFRNFGPYLCGGHGDINADIFILFRYPGTIASKVKRVFFEQNKVNGKGEEFVYSTEASKIVRMLKERGLGDRTFYVGYVIPCSIKSRTDPSKLLTNIFSNYIRRRLEIVSPKCVVTCRAWTTIFAVGGFTFRGSETAKNLGLGLARDIRLQKIGGNKSIMHITVARMVNQYNLNRDQFGNEKVDELYKNAVDPLIRVLKKKTEERVLIRMNRLTSRGSIDAISLMSSGVKIFSAREESKRKRKSLSSLLSYKRKKPNTCELDTFSRQTLLTRKPSQDDNDSSSIISNARLFPVEWVVDGYIGLVGNVSSLKLSDILVETKANMLITIDGRNHSNECNEFGCRFIPLHLNPEISFCIRDETRLMVSTTGMTADDLGMKSIDEMFALDISKSPNPKRSFKSLTIYKAIEYIMKNEGNEKDQTDFKHLPVVIIQTDNPQMTGSKFLNPYGDNRAYITAAIVIYAIRDIIARIKNGLHCELGKDLDHISPDVQLQDGDNYIINEIIIPPRRMYGKNNNPVKFIHEKGKIKSKDSPLRIREFFEKREMLDIINMMNASIGVKSGWGGFSTLQLQFLSSITKYISFMGANKDFRDPIISKDEIAFKEEKYQSANEICEKIHDSTNSESDITKYSKSRSNFCRFCVCHIHGHKDFFTNECKVKGCETHFKWKETHWQSNHKNDTCSRIPSLYTLAMKTLPTSLTVPKDVDEQNLHPNDVLLEVYIREKNIPNMKKCQCILCGGKGCST